MDDAVDVDEIDTARAQAQLEAAQAELAKIEAGESEPTAGSSSNASSTPRTSSRSRPAATPATSVREPPRTSPKGQTPSGQTLMSRVRGSRYPYRMSTTRFATMMITESMTVIPIVTE